MRDRQIHDCDGQDVGSRDDAAVRKTMTVKSLLAALCLIAAFSARASENQSTSNRLQQPTPDATTTTGLNTQNQQPTTTDLSAHSQRHPTSNNLQNPPQPAATK